MTSRRGTVIAIVVVGLIVLLGWAELDLDGGSWLFR